MRPFHLNYLNFVEKLIKTPSNSLKYDVTTYDKYKILDISPVFVVDKSKILDYNLTMPIITAQKTTSRAEKSANFKGIISTTYL